MCLAETQRFEFVLAEVQFRQLGLPGFHGAPPLKAGWGPGFCLSAIFAAAAVGRFPSFGAHADKSVFKSWCVKAPCCHATRLRVAPRGKAPSAIRPVSPIRA